MDELVKSIFGVIVVGLLGLGFIYMLKAIFGALGAGVSAVKAVGKTAVGNGSLSENMNLEFK